jgi:hypothetical protein
VSGGRFVRSRYSLPAVAFASGVFLILGSVLDWSGVAYSSGLDRGLAFAAGALMIVLAAAALKWRRRVLAFATVAGVLGLNMGVVNFLDINDQLHEYASYPDATVGVGIYLVLLGGALALFLGIITLIPRRWFRV